MGEYAMFNGVQIKIGTCEDMYYLRADQAHLVKPLSGNVDPVKDAGEIRFQFPFPDEDGTDPGTFGDYNRGLLVDAPMLPDIRVQHEPVHFDSGKGFGISLPCLVSEAGQKWVKDAGLRFHTTRGGAREKWVRIVQQRLLADRLVLICECAACGVKYRIPSLEEARPVIEACRREAKEAKGDGPAEGFWNLVAERIERGYTGKLPGAPRKARKAKRAVRSAP